MSNEEIITEVDKGLETLKKGLSKMKQALSSANQAVLQAEAYNKGLEDAWELARKIFTFNNNKMEEIFGVAGKRSAFDDLTPQEALAKYEAYEKEQAEIKVGDVVTDKEHKVELLVTIIYINHFDAIKITPDDEYGKFGATYSGMVKSDFKKTGKHIDIQSVLQQIGGAE